MLGLALVSLPSHANLRLPRRGFLNLGAWSLLGLKAPTAPVAAPLSSPAAPEVISTVSPAMLQYRRSSLRGILATLRPRGDVRNSSRDYLTEIDRAIIADWRAEDPANRSFLDADLAHYDERARAFRPELMIAEGKTGLEHRDEADRLWRIAQGLRDRVTDAPWSSFDWKTIYLERIGRAEASLGLTLGVDAAQVFQLTEIAIDPIGLSGERHGWLLVALAADDYQRPIYSAESVEAFARAMDSVLPSIGDQIRVNNSDFGESNEQLCARIVPLASANAEYFKFKSWPLRFKLDYGVGIRGVPPAEDLVPVYLKLRARLLLMLGRARELAPSLARDRIIIAITAVVTDLDGELNTLPERLDVIREADGRYAYIHQTIVPRSTPGRTSQDPHLPPIDPVRALHWRNFLRATAARLMTDVSVADAPVGDATVACDRALEPAADAAPGSPAELDYRPITELDLELTRDAAPAPASRDPRP